MKMPLQWHKDGLKNAKISLTFLEAELARMIEMKTKHIAYLKHKLNIQRNKLHVLRN
jgi:hypothetical protein